MISHHKKKLEYLAYYSTSNNIDTVENIIANGTAVGDFAKKITKASLTDLYAGRKYYVNVIVRDESGNQVAYMPLMVTTDDPTTHTPSITHTPKPTSTPSPLPTSTPSSSPTPTPTGTD